MKNLILGVVFSLFLSANAQSFADFSSDFDKKSFPVEITVSELKKNHESIEDEMKDKFVKPYLEKYDLDAVKSGTEWYANAVCRFPLNGQDGTYHGYIVSYFVAYPQADAGSAITTKYLLFIYSDMGEMAMKPMSIAYYEDEHMLVEKSGKEFFMTCKIESDEEKGLYIYTTERAKNDTFKNYSCVYDNTKDKFIVSPKK